MLQEFVLEIRDKKGSDNVVADHLSRLVHNKDLLPLKDSFSDEQLLGMEDSALWYANLVNYLVTKRLSIGLSQRHKLKRDARYYVWDEPYLWKHCADQMLRKCK